MKNEVTGDNCCDPINNTALRNSFRKDSLSIKCEESVPLTQHTVTNNKETKPKISRFSCGNPKQMIIHKMKSNEK